MKNLGVFAAVIAALCISACKKDTPEVGTTNTTSVDIVAQPAPAPKDDYLSTVRREQLVLRGRIDEELRTLERKLAAKNLDPKNREELMEKRETLRADASVVAHADERGWDELKAVVEHDLEGQPQM